MHKKSEALKQKETKLQVKLWGNSVFPQISIQDN